MKNTGIIRIIVACILWSSLNVLPTAEEPNGRETTVGMDRQEIEEYFSRYLGFEELAGGKNLYRTLGNKNPGFRMEGVAVEYGDWQSRVEEILCGNMK